MHAFEGRLAIEMADEALMMADEPPDAIRDLAVGAAAAALMDGRAIGGLGFGMD